MGVYNNVKSHYSSWSADEYEIELSNNIPNNYIAHIEFIYENRIPAGTIGKSVIDIPLVFSPFTISSNTIVDTATVNTNGNGNGIIEPSETAQITPFVQNTTSSYFNTITGYLFSEFPQINIWTNRSEPDGTGMVKNNYSYGTFNPNDIMQPTGDFVFTDSFATNYKLPLTLVLKGSISNYVGLNGCLYSEYSNIEYSWGLDFFINNSYSLPPDSLLPNYKLTNVPVNTAETLYSFYLYPNPNDGKFILNINDPALFENCKIEIVNLLGKPVYSSFIKQDNTFKIDISDEVAGIYFLKITSDKAIKAIKILKN